MVGQGAEGNLVKIIRSKIVGEARKSLRGQTFHRMDELLHFLRDIYFTTKPLYQLYGDLGKLHQKPEERVVTFVNRVREVLQKIIGTWNKENNPTPADLAAYKTNLEPSSMATFKRGPKPEIEQRMVDRTTLADTIKEAIKQEKFFSR